MFYENELRFLCDTLRKSHVRVSVVSPNDSADSLSNNDFDLLLGIKSGVATVGELLGKLEERTMYKSSNAFRLCHIYFTLPTASRSAILYIGPYLSEPLSENQILEIAEDSGIPPARQRYLSEYYSVLPVLPPSDHLFIMLDAFCERIWNSPSFSIVDKSHEAQMPASPINEPTRNDNQDDILASMLAMEKRYDFENELISAVRLGQLHKEKVLFSAFSHNNFERRMADPLRNAKNYCIIMNTLLRKAAEEGGVHPVYINRISSEFAARIEQMSAVSDNSSLMLAMFRSYCRLVRNHSMKDYSPLIQKTVLLIDSDLSANLSLRSLAEDQGVSSGYLATCFKRETGKTVSEYIREKRMKHAAHLLGTTHLQVQTIALHCGIMDVQYFSKIFKKHTGRTPKEYREFIKNIQCN